MNVPPPRLFDLSGNARPAARWVTAGLAAGALICACGLAAPATSSMPDNLGLCPTLAQAKTTSLVKNGMVTISAADYCEAVNDAFDTIGVTGYKATLTKGTDSVTLDMDIRKGTQLVGFIEFCLAEEDNSWITYRERNSSKTFNVMALVVFGDGDDGAEYFVYTAIAMALAIDPSLDKWDAQKIISYLVDNAERKDNGDFYYQTKNNGIRYALVVSDGDFYLLIGCSKA